MLLLSQCTSEKQDGISFSGAWQKVKVNNGIDYSSSEKETIIVKTDGLHFRIETTSNEGKETILYDGEKLHTNIIYNTGRKPIISSYEAKIYELDHFRFWITTPPKKSSSGDPILGRDTLVSQLRIRKINGHLTRQTWTDSETKIVLKTIGSLYNKGMDTKVLVITKECTDISYESVDKDNFRID